VSSNARVLVMRSIAEVRAALGELRARGAAIGFVPTMGALHAGHLSLLAAARARGDIVIASIFVNPTQFAPGEDYDRYPREEAADLTRCREAGAAGVFCPSAVEMYPPGAVTRIVVDVLSDTLCGPHRPGHFAGVATVVAKLLHIVQPARAYFGEKDAQQVAIIRRMVRDLNLPVEIVGCPTVREPDGLAMSSRNAYLSPAERAQATSISRGLARAREVILAGERDPLVVEGIVRATIAAAGPFVEDYVSVVEPERLQPVAAIDGPVLVAAAVRIGRTRLIDNVSVDPAERRR